MNKNALMGNVIVGQSGGPTAVINSSLAGVVNAARKNNLKCYGAVTVFSEFLMKIMFI